MPPTPSPVSTEADLITRIKAHQDSNALTTLVTQHTGIYLHIVDRFATAYPNTIRRDDLADDKLFNIYRFICDYDPDRGTKLSTYIGDRTSWMCKTLLKQDEQNPVRAGTYGPAGAVQLNDDTYTEGGRTVTLEDEAADVDVAAVADKDLKLDDILAAAWSLCADKRFIEILGYRHFQQTGQTCLSWRQIGERMGLSHERVRVLYHEGMDTIRAHLRERAA